MLLQAKFHQNCEAAFGRWEHYWVKESGRLDFGQHFSFKYFLLLERYHQNSQTILAATGMNGFKMLDFTMSLKGAL